MSTLMASSEGSAQAAAGIVNRRTFDPNRAMPIYLPIRYDQEIEKIKHFLGKFESVVSVEEESQDDEESAAARTLQKLNGQGALQIRTHKYLNMLQEVANMRLRMVTIDLDDVLAFEEENPEALEGGSLAQSILGNTWRYTELFASAIDLIMPASGEGVDLASMDAVNLIVSHREARMKAKGIGSGNQEGALKVPPALLRRYTVNFKAPQKQMALAVRQVHSDQVGHLIRLRGIITRVSEVKPMLSVGTYTCEKCGYEVYQEVGAANFMPLVECPSDECTRNGVKGQLFLQSRGSRFVKFQEARIQELTDQVPMGHIPRSMTVNFFGDLCRNCNPGDQVLIDGVYMPRPYTGFKAIRAGLLTDTYIRAQHLTQLKPKYTQSLLLDNPELTAQITELAADPDVYERLARSVAPEIYGHIDVKKALLLLMVGGVSKEMPDGMKIRGDINICMMGDPGVAKSQLLKYISKIAPRAVYTTGKGSSGVGLTAAVMKDPVTNEMILEGGALVLADNGICCIDEFDKMDESDRTAIHEVMEQQTISISKAGITTTLNARASILAAANPLYGRYNPKKSPRENINLPPALLSRFDLMFLMLDQPDLEADTRLAQHITCVHRTGAAPSIPVNSSNIQLVPLTLLRHYLGYAKTLTPTVPESLIDYITGAYVSLRLGDLSAPDSTLTTARTLLAILRLASAIAKLRLVTAVTSADVDEAMRLLQVSRSSVDLNRERANKHRDFEATPTTRCYRLICDLFNTAAAASVTDKSLGLNQVYEHCRARSFAKDQVDACLDEFDRLNIWSVDRVAGILTIFN